MQPTPAEAHYAMSMLLLGLLADFARQTTPADGEDMGDGSHFQAFMSRVGATLEEATQLLNYLPA